MAVKIRFGSHKWGSEQISLADAGKLRELLVRLGFDRPVIEGPGYITEEEYQERDKDVDEPLLLVFRFGRSPAGVNVGLFAQNFRNGVVEGIRNSLPVLRPGLHYAQYLLEIPGVMDLIEKTLEDKTAGLL